MVYLAVRSGNWAVQAASVLAGVSPDQRKLEDFSYMQRMVMSFATPVAHALVPASWMHSALVYQKRSKGVLRTGILLAGTSGVQVDWASDVNELFDKPRAWLLIALPGVTDEEIDSFATRIASTPYHELGALLAPFRSAGGVRSDNVLSASVGFMGRGLFCSEMVTVFLQTHKYPLDLTPGTTTTQQLVDRLLERYPLLRAQQFALPSTAPPTDWKKALLSVS